MKVIEVARLAFGAALLVLCGTAGAETQYIEIIDQTAPGSSSFVVDLEVVYAPSDNGLASGIGFRVHFDSSQLNIADITMALTASHIGTQVQLDVADYDNDPSTDMVINAGWADIKAAWPSGEMFPVTLYRVSFGKAEGFYGTSINISRSSTDTRYDFSGRGLSLD